MTPIFFYEDSNLINMQRNINLELSKVNVWFMVNRLSLNIKKTNYMYFGRKNVNPNFTIKINNVSIDQVESTKFLGIYIDDMLNWNSHHPKENFKMYWHPV